MKYQILFLFLTSSCALQQQLRNRSGGQKSVHIESKRSDSLQLAIKATHLFLQSTDHKIVAELLPEGMFEYSPQQGFKGRAHRVTIHQVQQQATLSQDSNSLQVVHSAQFANKEQANIQVRSKTIQKEGRHLGRPLTAAVAVLILFVLVLVWIRYRR